MAASFPNCEPFAVDDLLGFLHVAPKNTAHTLPFLLRPARMGCGFCRENFDVSRGADYPFATLHIVFSGCSFFRVNGGEYLLKKGDAFLILSGQEHRYYTAQNTQLGYIWIELETNGCLELFEWLRLQHTPILDAAVTTQLFEQLTKILRYVQQGGSDPFALSGLCYALLMRLCSAKANSPDSFVLPDCVGAALHFIGKNFAQTPSVAAIAQAANVSESCLSKHFRRCIGASPAHYILLKKMEYAIFLLKSTALSCEKIAEQTGFYDATHLYKVFVQHVGTSPSQMRAALEKSVSYESPIKKLANLAE